MTRKVSIARFIIVLTVFVCSFQPCIAKGRVYAPDGLDVNIGLYRSLDRGNRASIRRMSRLLRKYNADGYVVRWSVRIKGKVFKTATMYDPWQQSLARDYISFGDEGIARLLYDQTSQAAIHAVARRNGTFKDFLKYGSTDYSEKMPVKSTYSPVY